MTMRFFSLAMAFMLSSAYAFATDSATSSTTTTHKNGSSEFQNEINSMVTGEIFKESDRLYADISNTENQEMNKPENTKNMDNSENKTLAELNNRSIAEETDEDTASQQEASPNEQPEQPVAEAPVEDTPSRWSFYTEFWNEGLLDFDSGFETYITIRPQYQLTDKLSVRFSFESTVLWSSPGTQRERTTWSPGDSYFMFNLNTVSLGVFDMFGYVRIYLPFSERSVRMGQIARVRTKVYFTLPLSRNLRFTIRPEINYYQHSVDSVRQDANSFDDLPQCLSAQYCSDVNTNWRVEPMAGLIGKIYGPLSFESIHGFRLVKKFMNQTTDTAATTKEYELFWYNESGIIWDVPKTPITLLFGFYDLRRTGGSFWKRLPIISYFTGPHDNSWWVFSIWASI